MADFRSVQTRMWREDEWFDELEDNDARMFWVYLFTNPSSSPAGIYRLTMRTMAHEAHISYDKACELMERFSADKKAYFEGGVVWVVNMRRLQFPDLDGSGAWQIATKMQSDIDAIPDTNPLKGEYLRRNGYPIITPEVVKGKEVKRVSIQYGYPIDTISVNSNITETVTVTETETILPSQATPPPAKKPRTVEPGSQPDMFGAIVEVCRVDAKLKQGQIAKQSKALLEAGYTPEQVRAFPEWWKSHDWRGKRLEIPTMAQLAELIKQSVGTNGTDPAKKATTGTFRQPSPDGTQWIHTDMVTGKEVKREPRSEEEAMF